MKKLIVLFIILITAGCMLVGFTLPFQQLPILQNSWDLRNTTAGVGINIANRNLNYHSFNWSVQSGALSACTLSFQSSPDNVTWTEQSTGDCSTTGNALLNFVSNYIRIRATTFTVMTTPALVTVNWGGYTYIPGSFNNDGSLTISSPLKVVGATNKYVKVAHDGTDGTISQVGTGVLNFGSTNNLSKLVSSLGTPSFSNPGDGWFECSGTAGVAFGRICTFKVDDTGGILNVQTLGKTYTFFNRQTGLTGAYTSGTFTTPATQDASYIVGVNGLVTASGNFAFGFTYTYKDESNTTRVKTLTLQAQDDSSGTSLTNAFGTGSFASQPQYFRAKANTSISIQSNAAGTFTSVTYNAEASLSQVN